MVELNGGDKITVSGSEMLCPGCEYSTMVFDGDDHSRICPECEMDALLPVQEAREVRLNRNYDGDTIDELLSTDDPTEPVSHDALDAMKMGAKELGILDTVPGTRTEIPKGQQNSLYGMSVIQSHTYESFEMKSVMDKQELKEAARETAEKRLESLREDLSEQEERL